MRNFYILLYISNNLFKFGCVNDCVFHFILFKNINLQISTTTYFYLIYKTKKNSPSKKEELS